MSAAPAGIQIFSTAPQSADVESGNYLARAAAVARWSEAAGCKGILIYTDNRLIDPWLVAQVVLQNTGELCPLVATQPAYMHPYAVAKMIASFGYLYARRIYLNMVAGGFRNDLLALGDSTEHDQRYDRLREYTWIIGELLREGRVSLDGQFYQVKNLAMNPPLPAGLTPGFFLSGSSEAARGVGTALGATMIEYPQPGESYPEGGVVDPSRAGIRIGIISHPDDGEAWRLAEERFPEDRRGQLTHQVAMKVTDSRWHRQLSNMGDGGPQSGPYWLRPFRNSKTFCPYLVGSHDIVAREIATYIRAGFGNFILDIPAEEEDLRTVGIVFSLAKEMAA